MTLEFWPRKLLTPKPAPKPKRPPKPRKPRRPKQPLTIGKANQMLSAAIIMGDHELASFLDRATIYGTPDATADFRKRLDEVMAPLA